MIAPATIEILLADDDEDDRLLFREALEDALIKARLTLAKDGEQLLEYVAAFDKYQPDILFLDINMPRTNGKDCLKVIRKKPELNSIPIVMFSTASYQNEIEETYEAGANLYLCKRVFAANEAKILTRIFTPTWRQDLQKRDKKKYVVANTLF